MRRPRGTRGEGKVGCIIWLIIVATFAIYITAGKVVLQWRRELLKYTHDYNGDVDVSSPSQPSSPAIA